MRSRTDTDQLMAVFRQETTKSVWPNFMNQMLETIQKHIGIKRIPSMIFESFSRNLKFDNGC